MLSLATLGTVLLLGPTASPLPSVESIVAKHMEARGGLRRIKAVRSARALGVVRYFTGTEVPFVLEFKRPGRLRMTVEYQGQMGIEVYADGAGWLQLPFPGEAARSMTSAELMAGQDDADFDGALVDWVKKGHRVRLVGVEELDGQKAYRLEILRQSGTSETIWLDASTWLEARSLRERRNGDESRTVLSIPSDYRRIAGLMLPFQVASLPVDAPDEIEQLRFETFGVDVPVDDARFRLLK